MNEAFKSSCFPWIIIEWNKIAGLYKLHAQLWLHVMCMKICARYWLPTQLLITCPHKPLCFKKIRTTTIAFLIFNTVVPNPYSHSTAFNPQSFIPLHPYLKFQACLIDLSQSDIQIPFELQIDNSIQQCANSWHGIF